MAPHILTERSGRAKGRFNQKFPVHEVGGGSRVRQMDSCFDLALLTRASLGRARARDVHRRHRVSVLSVLQFGYDFDVLVDFFGSDTVKTWRDSEGDVTRIKIHDYGTGTIYPDTDPTNRETGSGPINITIDFLKETYTISGQESHNNIPGEGRVAHQSGTITSGSRF